MKRQQQQQQLTTSLCLCMCECVLSKKTNLSKNGIDIFVAVDVRRPRPSSLDIHQVKSNMTIVVVTVSPDESALD